jgi:hypothetical protein
MHAVRTRFTAEDVRRRGSLTPLRETIENAIPLSAGVYNTVIDTAATKDRIAELEAKNGARKRGGDRARVTPAAGLAWVWQPLHRGESG